MTFSQTAHVDVNQLLTALKQTVITCTEKVLHRHDRLESAVEKLVLQNNAATAPIQPAPLDSDIQYFNRWDLRLVKTIQQCPKKPALYWAEYEASGKVVRAVVKIFPASAKSKSQDYIDDEIKRIKELWHPHLPQLLGRSLPKADRPFLVLSDYTERNVRNDLEPKLLKDPVGGFMAALEVLEGVASAMNYLREQPGMGIAALNACSQVPTFRLGTSGQVLVGHGLFYSEPWTGDPVTSASPDNLLINRFWRITMELLYGDENAIDWGDWNSIQTAAPHVQPFLTLTSFDCPSFECLSERLTGLLGSLESRLMDGSLNYSQIRTAMSAIPGVDLDYLYLPPIPLDVALGDIGYIKGDTFVKLYNIQQDIPFDPVPYPGYFRASGDFTTEKLANGDIMHTFTSPVFIQILYRDRSEACPGTMRFLSYFIKNARAIHERYCVDLDVDVTELILITNSYYDRRFATYEARMKPEHAEYPLPDVRLIEQKQSTWANMGEMGVRVKCP
ncbi:hypothetical protein FRB95_008586 [Tulasnella sp. JGI-2019a]|nr:hypothetical protein FRB95_008586 [Tulasnella sp. JGI-2019a]